MSVPSGLFDKDQRSHSQNLNHIRMRACVHARTHTPKNMNTNHISGRKTINSPSHSNTYQTHTLVFDFYTQIMFKLKRLESKSIIQVLIRDQRPRGTNGRMLHKPAPLNMDANGFNKNLK